MRRAVHVSSQRGSNGQLPVWALSGVIWWRVGPSRALYRQTLINTGTLGILDLWRASRNCESVSTKKTAVQSPFGGGSKDCRWRRGSPIGADIKTVQFRWPVGLPWVRSLSAGLWEVRSNLADRTARVIFAIDGGEMILLHGFIKKTRKTPAAELELAKKRVRKVREQR